MKITVRNTLSMGGVNSANNRSIDVDNVISGGEDIPAGKSGTAGANGVMTLASGHGFTTSSVVAVVWSTGYRYNCSVSSSSSTSITVADGAGDALPTSGSVVVSALQEVDVSFSGNQLQALALGGDVALITTLEDASSVHLAKRTDASGAYQWDSENGENNPVSGDSITKAHVYAASATAGTSVILAGYNND